MPGAWMRGIVMACQARPGWSLAALALFLAALACCGAGDHAVQPLLHGLDGLSGVQAVVELVRPFGRGEVAILVALVVGLAGRRALAGRLLLALAISAILTWALKLGVGRIRPNGAAFSFVSGDTSTAWAMLPLLAGSWWTAVAAAVVGIGVAMARVVEGYHWPADVLGGAAIGILAAVLAAAWPLRWWPPLLRRSTWTWVGLAGLAVAAAVAVAQPGNIRIAMTVWLPPLLGWACWSRLRPHLRRPLALPRWTPWAVGLALVAALTALALATTLMDRDEPRNALAAREMLAGGHWLVPTFNGEWRLAKPILPYWLMTGFLRLGLPTDLACRLPAVLAMAGAVVLSALAARRMATGSRLDSDRLAAVTAMVLATSPLVLVSGSAATTDAVLLLGIAATMWALVESMSGPLRWWHLVVAGPALGWAVLAKGPMGLLVPVATVACAGIAQLFRRPAAPPAVRGGTWITLGAAVVCGALLALAWFIPANAETGGVMYREMIGNQVVQRVLAARESHGGGFWVSLPYYLPVLIVACIAWLPALAVAARTALTDAGPPRGLGTILLAWALPVLVAVTLTQTKLPHYLLPMLPPVAVLIAVAILGDAAPRWWRWGGRIQAGLLAVLAVGLLLSPAAGLLQDGGLVPARVRLAPLAAPGLAAGLALWLLARLLWREVRNGRRQSAAVAAGIGIAVLVVALVSNAGRLERLKPAPALAAVVRNHAVPGTMVAVDGFDEPSLLYYIGPELGPVRILGGSPALNRWAAGDGPGICVVERRRLDEAGGLAALPVRQLGHVRGYNYSNGKAVELFVLGRKLP